MRGVNCAIMVDKTDGIQLRKTIISWRTQTIRLRKGGIELREKKKTDFITSYKGFIPEIVKLGGTSSDQKIPIRCQASDSHFCVHFAFGGQHVAYA